MFLVCFFFWESRSYLFVRPSVSVHHYSYAATVVFVFTGQHMNPFTPDREESSKGNKKLLPYSHIIYKCSVLSHIAPYACLKIEKLLHALPPHFACTLCENIFDWFPWVIWDCSDARGQIGSYAHHSIFTDMKIYSNNDDHMRNLHIYFPYIDLFSSIHTHTQMFDE